MNIIVTGAKGFIGSHLVKALKQKKHNVIEWDSNNDSKRKNVKNFYADNAEYVIHLAAYANVRKSLEDPQSYWRNNVENTKYIQDICNVSDIPLLYASSSCIHQWWLSPYGTTKKVNEITAHAKQTALRFTTVYGEGARDNMFMSKIFNHSLEYATTHLRDFIHISDVVSAILLLMRYTSILKPAYDIGTGVNNSVNELAELAGYSNLPVLAGDACEAEDNTANITDLKDMGWEPKVSVDQYIINKMIAY